MTDQGEPKTMAYSGLRAETIAWVQETVGGELTAIQRVPASGRPGYLLDVERADGHLDLFLQRGRDDPEAGGSSFMGLEREAEIYRALRPRGFRVPTVWAVSLEHNALLVDRAIGAAWLHPPRDPHEALSVAQDFMRHLAALHSVPARDLDLPSFDRLGGIRDHQQAQLVSFRRTFERCDQQRRVDALSWFLLDLLESHIPDENGEPVLVQGDTGPGNLMYLDEKVTAVVDWELAHLGDPMDDIAWLSWRTVQHTFPDFPTRLREYESLSAHTVNDARVRYYRLNAFARLGPYFGTAPMTPDDPAAGLAARRPSSGAADHSDRALDGSALIMNVLHRRMRLEAIFAILGVEIPDRDVITESEPPEPWTIFDTVLDDLHEIAGRVNDRAARVLSKGAARKVKYLKELARNGAVFEAQELDDIQRLLGRRLDSVCDARAALATAALDGSVDIEDYLDYHWQRLVRDDHLLRHASGAMYERTWPPLR